MNLKITKRQVATVAGIAVVGTAGAVAVKKVLGGGGAVRIVGRPFSGPCTTVTTAQWATGSASSSSPIGG